MNRLAIALALFCLVQQDALSFSLNNHQSHHHGERRTTSHSQAQRPSSSSSLSAMSAVPQKTTSESIIGQSTTRTSTSVAMKMMTTALVVLVTTLSVAFGVPLVALADEYGVEKEAPTLLTGETVEVRFSPALHVMPLFASRF
jgi:hypothetical protein